jgi:hypothetical protein
VRSFSGQTRAGTGEGGTDGGGELLPARRPLDEEPGLVMEINQVFELESFSHKEYSIVWFELRG